jgi:predicted transcriptional regulator/transcriptional regulator with XRE-family HTH domain
MTVKRRLFAGSEIKRLRQHHSLNQRTLATELGISAPYLSQIENDGRPLTGALIERLAALFPLDWRDLGVDELERLAVTVREAAADPLFDGTVAPEQLARFVEQHPQLARQFVLLHEAFRAAGQRLEMIDEAIDADNLGQARLPWEEVRDWFHLANNYVDALDRAAEELAYNLCGDEPSPSAGALSHHLRHRFAISLHYEPSVDLRKFNPHLRHLVLDSGQPAQTKRFQLAHQLAALAFDEQINALVQEAQLRTHAARQLLFVGLSNYAAGALLMPYNQFRDDARSMRHDVDRLSQYYGTSFEQTCHRLSTLQREHARGVPFFFCRVDMAGNITKRHSATRLQFARFGGACPLWIVHEAVAIPDRIQVQLAETPDGVRYVSMAKGLVKASGRFDRMPRRYAVALGCEIDHAHEFVYADGMDLASERAVTKIGVSCRLCSREDCDQRSFPPSDGAIRVDPNSRRIVPYQMV